MAGVGEQRGDANARHPSESSLLSGKAKFAQKILACGRKAKIFWPEIQRSLTVAPAKAGAQRLFGDFKSLGPGLRRDDEPFRHLRQIERDFPRTAVSESWDDVSEASHLKAKVEASKLLATPLNLRQKPLS
jgi:hypothetical protein